MKILTFIIGLLLVCTFAFPMTATSPLAAIDPVGPPNVEFAYATNNTNTSIDILAIVNFNGLITNVRVFWGKTDQYNDSSENQKLDYYPAPQLVFPISGLEPATIYHFRVVAQNDSGVAWSEDFTASTDRIITLPADSITATSARLNGKFISDSTVAELSFGVWLADLRFQDGADIPVQTFDGDSSEIKYSYTLTGLLPNTTYRFRTLRYSTVNFGEGNDLLFTTLDTTRGSMLTIPLSFQTPDGFTSTIHFGLHTYATNCKDFSIGETELPPYPPTVTYPEPRFRGCGFGFGSILDFHAYLSATQIDTYRVNVPGGLSQFYPIRVTWPQLDSLYEGPVMLKVPDSVVEMKTTSSYYIMNDNITFLLIIASGPHPHDNSLTAITNRTSIFGQTQAQISALLFPRQLPTAAWFEWGIDLTYGNSSSLQSVNSNSILRLLETTIDGLQSGTLYHYRIVAQDSAGTTTGADQSFVTQALTGIEANPLLPDKFTLAQNYPNPFNPETRIDYTLPKTVHVQLAVYNVLGQKVKTLVDGLQDAGFNSVRFTAATLPSGLYFYRMQTGDFVDVKKMLLMK